MIMRQFKNKKNAFAKGYTPNWSEEVLYIRKVQNVEICKRIP